MMSKVKNILFIKYSIMEWIKSKDFPEEMTTNIQNFDSALCEIEAVVNELTSVPLNEVHSSVSFC